MAAGSRSRLRYALVALWLAFTVSLSTWWLIFGLQQSERIRRLDHDEAPRLERVQQMLLWEGAVLIASLLGGGLMLLTYVRRERQRHRQVEEFFAAFTHDMKTALASLRLQAESLEEDLERERENPLLRRLLKDSVRLQLQLENSLFFAHRETGRLLIEPVPLRRVIDTVRHDWPELSILQEADAVVAADRRALESVVRNVLQNAVVHGQAGQVTVRVERSGDSRVRLFFQDDGRGMAEDASRLGELFYRRGPNGGTGVGLYISKQLTRRMGGRLEIHPTAPGFSVALELPEGGR